MNDLITGAEYFAVGFVGVCILGFLALMAYSVGSAIREDLKKKRKGKTKR